MLNFSIKQTPISLLFILLVIYTSNKALNFKKTYDIFIFLIINLTSVTLLLFLFNLENYAAFIFLSELTSIFLILTILLKEKFFFRKKKKITTAFLVFILPNFFFFKNFEFFNFFKKLVTFNDFFKLFFNLNNFTTVINLISLITLSNVFILFFPTQKNNNFNFYFFFKKQFFFKNFSFLKSEHFSFSIRKFN
jgi:hypothetical protein